MLGHVIYNHSHLDDCRIQQEISKNLYGKVFDGVHLVHAYNGEKKYGYKKYLEDKFIHIKNRGHFQGAVDLINAGMKYFHDTKLKRMDYVLVTAADTWLLDERFLKSVVDEMKSEKKVLAVSSWGKAVAPEKPAGFSTDFFIIDLAWNREARLWPLDYPKFVKKYGDFFYLQYVQPVVEVAFQFQYQKYFAKHFIDNDIWRNRNASLRRIIEREPVHDATARISEWEKIGLYTAPIGEQKQKALWKYSLAKIGPEATKLATSKDLSYYNAV